MKRAWIVTAMAAARGGGGSPLAPPPGHLRQTPARGGLHQRPRHICTPCRSP